MYGKLSVFMSLLVVACAAPAILFKNSDVPVLVTDDDSAVEEGTFSNPVRLPVPDPKILDRNFRNVCTDQEIPTFTYEECLKEKQRLWETKREELECLPPQNKPQQHPCFSPYGPIPPPLN